MNRASLGVQDLDPTVQKAINRAQPLETVARAADLAFRSAFSSLNMDLMYGLPVRRWRAGKRRSTRCWRFNPDRLSLFGYAHVPWMKSHQKLIRRRGAS